MKLTDHSDEAYYEPVYTIGHAAQKLGLAVPTLRMYEQAGLIIPYRTETQRRLYSRHDISYIEIILDLIRNHHLNLEAIKHLAALTPCWRIIDCPEEKHKVCEAYTEGSIPCWLLPQTSYGKTKDECRTCNVYLACPKMLKDPKSLLKFESY